MRRQCAAWAHRDRAGLGLIALGLMAATLTCTPAEPPQAGPVTVAPEIRIGLVVGAPRLEFSGDSGLQVLDSDGAVVRVVPPGTVWKAVPGSEGMLMVLPPAGGRVTLNGRAYRGRMAVVRGRTGLTAINHVPIEAYLLSVVASEMGRRDTSEAEALRAQAILARTYAIRNLGKRASEGFDLYATVVDQVYGGMAAEYPLATWAVQVSAGQVVTWQGVPIDGFFFSTCAGRTAEGTEVFAAASRPYLVSHPDLAPDGSAWCRISPRYRWREEWSREQLRAVLRQSLPPATGTTAEAAATVESIRVAAHTGSGRVARVTIALARGAVEVSGPAIRQVLHPIGETTLRSALFQLTEVRDSGRLSRLIAEGQGAGHGVGFCQWGAVGRSRAGQDAPMILAAYFPGTAISRAY
jgi:stage II sporulation protein D